MSWISYYVGQMHFISGAGTRSVVVPAIIFRNIKQEEFFFLGLILTVLSVFFQSVIQYVVECCRFIICLMIRDFY